MMAVAGTTMVRAVIHTKDGKEIAGRWRPSKPAEELGPDELPAMWHALRVADRYVKRHKLKVRTINGEYRTRKTKATR